MRKISSLQFITNSATLAEQACIGGIDWVQLRMKNVSYDAYKQEALRTQEICKKHNATLIINDLASLALDINADGVHIGKEDTLTEEELDALLKGGYIIGRTTNTVKDILQLKSAAVSYFGLGPFRFTNTKQNLSPILGVNGYADTIKQLTADYSSHPPIIAIGGIADADIPTLLATGVSGIAISGAIALASNVSETAKAYKALVNKILTAAYAR